MELSDLSVNIDTNGLVTDLQKLIRIPSVSARKQNLEQCAKEIVSLMKKIGISSEVIYYHHHNVNEKEVEVTEKSSIPPIVYGEIKSKANPNGKTILFYNHYDVQPEEPLELWEHDPFSGKVIENKIFGRGASDDKGELITRLKAVEHLLKETGDVPINIKFLIEGEEEIGSINISKYLEKFKEKLKSDIVIWEFGYIDQNEKPIISLGMKGLLYVELTAIGPSRDIHSSLAAIIENPAWRIVHALATMTDKKGKILIKNWYNEVKELSNEEIRMTENEPFDEESFKKEYGISKFLNGIDKSGIKRALISEPTCNIAGLYSGYTGKGAKTITPSKASVKLDFRLVPHMDPMTQLERLKDHLKENGFDDIKVTLIHGEAAGRTDINDPYVKIVQHSANEIFGGSILSVSSAGTGPMHNFINTLKIPCISIGGTFIFSKIHSPNEYARIDLLEKTTKCMIKIIENISKSKI